MGRQSQSGDRSQSAKKTSPGVTRRKRRRNRSASGERTKLRSCERRSASVSGQPQRRRGHRSASPARNHKHYLSRSRSRSPPPRRSRSPPRRSRSGPRRRSRRRGHGHGRGSPSQRRRQGSRSPRNQGRRRDYWSPQRRRPENNRATKPNGCRTIWVGWLENKPEENEIIEFFKDCGAVSEAKISERHPRGFFAHITFEETASVDDAMKKVGEEFMGSRIQLDFAYMDKVAANSRGVDSRRYRPKSVKPPDGHTLWIGDVSIDAVEQDLIDLFESCGKIEMICLHVNQLRNGQFGHVKFFETEDVDKAVELAGTPVKGVPIRLDYAEDKPLAAYRAGKDRTIPEKEKPEGCRTVWIGGLPEDCTEDAVIALFERCGEIRETRLDRSKRSGTFFCHVEFAETEAVDRAIRLSGERLNGSRIRVDFAENRLKGDSGGKGKYMPPPGEMRPDGYAPPPGYLPPPGWMPPPGYPAPGYPPYPPLPHGGPPPGWHGPPRHGEAPGSFALPPRPSSFPGQDGSPSAPDGVPQITNGTTPASETGPPPGYHGPPGYPPTRPPDFFGPPPFWGPRPPPGYPGGPPPYWGPPPGHFGGPPPGYPGPPPAGPSAPPAPSSAPPPSVGVDATRPPERSHSPGAKSCYSSYSYSYSVSPERK